MNRFRIVWRIAKQPQTGRVLAESRCALLTRYMSAHVARWLDDCFLVRPRLVQLRKDHLCLLTQVSIASAANILARN